MNILKDALLEDFWIMPATPKYEDSGIPYITSKNIKNDKIVLETANYISQESYDKISKNRPINVGDILISMIGTLGQTAVVKESDCPIYGQNVFLIRLNKEVIDERYFINFFKSKSVKEQLEGKQNKSTQSYLKAGHIESLYISLPTLEEQKEKANKLDKISRIIELKKDELNKLDELVKSRFIELFNGYEKVKLSDIADIIMGQSPDSKSYNDDGDGLPFFQGKADYGDKYTVVRHWTNEPNKIAEENSVLMSVRAPVGPVNIANTKCCIGRGLCAINAKKELTNNEFLYNALKAMEADIASMGSGSTFKAITKNDVYGLMVPKAPLDLQNQFSEFSEKVDKSKFIVQQSLDKYQ